MEKLTVHHYKGYGFTVLGNNPKIAKKVEERIDSFSDPEKIPAGGFSLLEGLVSINVPEGVKDIGDNAFSGCISLNEVNIPISTRHIGNGVFDGCSNLNKILIPELTLEGIGLDNLYLKSNLGKSVRISILQFPFIADKSFKDRTDLNKMDVPESIISIGNSAFSGCINLEEVNMPNNVVNIGTDAFSGCSRLKKVNISNNVRVIPMFAFNGCEKLKEINLPDNLAKISENAFWGCSSLKQLKIPSSVKTIGSGAFFGSGLEQVTIPNGVKSIGSGAFSCCSSLTEVTIPPSVTEIGKDAFKYTKNLKKVIIHPSVLQLFGKNNIHEKLGLSPNVEIFVDCNGAKININAFDKLNDKNVVFDKLNQRKFFDFCIQSIGKNYTFSNSNINVFKKLKDGNNSGKHKPRENKEPI